MCTRPWPLIFEFREAEAVTLAEPNQEDLPVPLGVTVTTEVFVELQTKLPLPPEGLSGKSINHHYLVTNY